MKKIPKKIIMIPILIISFYIVYLFASKANVTVTEVVSSDGEKVIQVHDQGENLKDEFPYNMSEASVQQAIHNMSHQKVLAKEKWGALPLTPKRVKRLIEVVKANEKEYAHSDLYLGILEDWAENNFSNAVYDHNTIWRLQDGTTGEAYGIASPEEEMKFIQEHFDVKK
ncbi:DUF6241 domain-containing protein [Neobacillus sp. PS3-34]|uniref:DUF6241 domain-containing protein n=1 Tax=Neobacillus sp. PS3-34 TaxID=3070678 RepID=UPI0027DED515|nr:DUF6241 domain-containing protein [Neobacillus sp. PS3-34]WML47219.1 DUF6241 domain-containing protein [Neobacillus sp. PS3-34]